MTHLDGFGVKTQAFLLVGQEVLHIFTLVALELDDFAHLGVAHDGAIAGKLLLDHLEDLLLVKLFGETLDGRQGLAAIALCATSAGLLVLGVVWRGCGRCCEDFALLGRGGEERTLDTNMNVVLLSLLDLAGIFIRFRERVCSMGLAPVSHALWL